MKRLTLIPLFLCLSLIAACTNSFQVVESGTRYSIRDDSFSVTPGLSWSRMTNDDIEAWTRDGYKLNQLYLFAGVEDGERLPVMVRSFEELENNNQLIFNKTMTPLDIKDLVVNTMKVAGYIKIEVLSQTPENFGGKPGFRQEMKLYGTDNVERRALMVTTMADDRLFGVLFTATKIHYYQSLLAEVENIIRSVRFELDEDGVAQLQFQNLTSRQTTALDDKVGNLL